jgi:molecular chaperone Hsp33
MLELKNVRSEEVMNQILHESYQTNSEVIVGQQSDQSLLITKLPPLSGNVLVDETVSRKDYVRKNQQFFHDVFEMASDDIEKIVTKFEDHGLAYLGSRQISFFCPCSQERMVLNLRGLYSHDIDHLFEGKDSLEIKCDYCRKEYQISKADVIGS